MPKITLDDAFVAEVSRVIRKLDGAKFAEGMGGENSPSALVIGPAYGNGTGPAASVGRSVLVKPTAKTDGDPAGKYTAVLRVGHATSGVTGLVDGLKCEAWNLWEANLGGTTARSIVVNTGPYMGIVAGSNETTGQLRVYFFALPYGVTFTAKLTTDGGGGGSPTATSNWTYTAKTLDDTITLGTTLTPQRTRPTGNYQAGNYGICCYDNTGTLLLIDAGEYLSVVAC